VDKRKQWNNRIGMNIHLGVLIWKCSVMHWRLKSKMIRRPLSAVDLWDLNLIGRTMGGESRK
jgi:hypothetical protein